MGDLAIRDTQLDDLGADGWRVIYVAATTKGSDICTVIMEKEEEVVSS